MTLNEQTLTTEGLPLEGKGSVLVIACGALAREILDIKAANALEHIDLQCLPAILHNSPEKIPEEIEKTVLKHKHNYTSIYIAYADCGTGGLLQKTCEKLGVEMIEGPHCYSFFEGNTVFAERDEFTAFYLTDFLVRQFEAFVIKPLGLDRHPELRDMYFGHYEKLVYQAQITDPALEAKAKECATKLGLVYEHRPTGYGDLEDWLQKANLSDA